MDSIPSRQRRSFGDFVTFSQDVSSQPPSGEGIKTHVSNTRIVARNTGWYGLEQAISFALTLFTSIAIARTLGPAKMGYMIYVMWIASIVSGMGGIGIPETTRKYMAEFLGMGDKGTARYIYFRTLILQTMLATVTTVGITLWVLTDANNEYKLASVLVTLSIWPCMINSISAQANVATEDLAANFPASIASMFTFFLIILATVIFKWGVVGVGASIFFMRSVDFAVRILPTVRRMLSWEKDHVLPVGLTTRMMTFAWQSVTSMILGLIVWGRSEVVLLKYLSSDIRQVAYYSVAFSMAERLLIATSVFGSAATATIFAQYGRDKSRLSSITASSFRYLALTSIPLHLISAALAVPALLILFGDKYSGAALVVMLAPLFCMPKAFIGPAQSVLESMEKQQYVILSTFVAGIVDLGVAWYLIPAHGAVGAVIGSGAAQVMANLIMWTVCINLCKVALPWMQVAKVSFISILASLTAHYIAVQFTPLWGILLGGSASLVVLFVLFYVMRVLEPEDRNRFQILIETMPKPLARPMNKIVSLLIHPAFAISECDK